MVSNKLIIKRTVTNCLLYKVIQPNLRFMDLLKISHSEETQPDCLQLLHINHDLTFVSTKNIKRPLLKHIFSNTKVNVFSPICVSS